jgi:hypothetical protein
MTERVMPIRPTLFSVSHTSCEETIATVNAADNIVRSADRSTSGRAAVASVSDLRAQVLKYLMFAPSLAGEK